VPGATAGLIGRPHLGKLAVAGEASGARVLGIIRSEIDPALALGG
jgi:isopentenyl diphosphate isomerase/L-lactate dehydrogenase-like FMN-dependent dehydrogenase